MCSKKMKKSCFDYALWHISHYPKTVADLKRFLLRKWYDVDTVESALSRLIELWFLDDATYTRLVLASEVCRKGKPIYVVEQKLLLKGVDRDIISQERSEVEEEIQEGMRERIGILAERLWDRWYETMKILQNLSGKGYPYDLVKEIVGINL